MLVSPMPAGCGSGLKAARRGQCPNARWNSFVEGSGRVAQRVERGSGTRSSAGWFDVFLQKPHSAFKCWSLSSRWAFRLPRRPLYHLKVILRRDWKLLFHFSSSSLRRLRAVGHRSAERRSIPHAVGRTNVECGRIRHSPFTIRTFPSDSSPSPSPRPRRRGSRQGGHWREKNTDTEAP
jgi:hypothetical protein